MTCAQLRLAIVPCSLTDVRAWVDRVHRHHRAPVSGLFALAVADEQGEIRGVAIVGRPVARMLQDGWTAEVTRVATDGCENAPSALYGACWRAARALDWRRLITYTLQSEPGTSLRAAGWRVVGETKGGVHDPLSPCCSAPIIPGTVLDPFAGAGTTVMVAVRMGRRGLGIELNPEYCEMARARILADHGAVAELDGDTPLVGVQGRFGL